MVKVTFNTCITYKIHNKNQTSTMKLILLSHKNALHTARGMDGLYAERNTALV